MCPYFVNNIHQMIVLHYNGIHCSSLRREKRNQCTKIDSLYGEIYSKRYKATTLTDLESYKYLGHVIDEGLSWCDHVASLKAKLRTILMSNILFTS